MDIDKLNNLKIAKSRNIPNKDRIKITSKSGSNHATTIFIKGRFWAKLYGEEFKVIPIKITVEDFIKSTYIYSHIDNDEYESWTIKIRGEIYSMPEISMKYWSIIKPHQRIAGNIIDGEYILDIDYVNHINEANYNRLLNKKKNATSKNKRSDSST